MNALTVVRYAHCDQGVLDFHEAIVAERDVLSNFLDLPRSPAVSQVISSLARLSSPVIFTGVGKSGHIAAKAASTFSSLGMPATFVNAAEAAHGDLGCITPHSWVIMLSNSGSTDELLRLLPVLKGRACKLVAIVGHAHSPMARQCDHVIHAPISAEADPLGMAPTASTTLQLAICDALAVAISRRRGLSQQGFLQNHPAGLLGRHAIPVRDLMRRGDDVPTVGPNTALLDLLSEMSCKRIGAACVVGEGGILLGLVVDGDVRRALQKQESMNSITAKTVMKTSPRTVAANATVGDVIAMRKDAGTPWLVMPVTEASGRLVGILHAQDVVG